MARQERINNAAALWTGGKDCSLALHEAMADGYCVDRLVTFAPVEANFLAHPLKVMAAQAKAIGLPHQVVRIATPYKDGYRAAIERMRQEEGIGHLITGDIDLVEGMPNFVKECCEGLDVQTVMPLWNASRPEVLERLLEAGFEAILSCVKSPWFTMEWLGRTIDRQCVEEFEHLHATKGLDLCGENGEYHTLVLDGPIFRRRLRLIDPIGHDHNGLMYLEIPDVELVAK